ncbi:PREDICTED: uncharacterized protein LOC104727517 [Camelina sativa]|uniref:Uncharacterized protein LOC104727517 n=1 Tax=Camelina sativa TaxID=90675 RepID=A0ABM0URB6_CAMSA|nr:PREDICTED: uncharacterized protein LOC104727517 [Camelina sativa]
MPKTSIIRFIYDGYYSSIGKDVRWISSKDNEVYSFLMKTSSSDVSYAKLVEKICSKIKVDVAMKNLRIDGVNKEIALVGGTNGSGGGGIVDMYVREPSLQNLVVVENEDRDVEGNQSGPLLWEDGLDFTIGQEFGSKKAIQSLIEKAGHKNCFEFVVKKSEPVAAAREAKKEADPEIELHDLCSKYYWIEVWVLAYSRTIYPVPHSCQWIVPRRP